ncbi:MAG: shikimate kinase [Tannerellaceae bacterium]|nr:shikimate kinase [Tannerellaceae bacterium]
MKRIFLIGYMGAGKTTIGKELARRMELSFVDLDAHIEARYHKTISRLFAEKGENEFREIERRILHEVAMFENVLISTGGGAPCFYDNMSFMNHAGQTVYLKVSPGELSKRLELVKHTRPVLNGRCGEELLSFVSDSLEKRNLYYMQAAVVFDVEQMTTSKDVQKLTRTLETILS